MKQISTFIFVGFIWILATIINPGSCHVITLDVGQEECFYERLVKGSKLKLAFEVLDGGSLDVDLVIRDPSSVIHSEYGKSSGHYSIEANQDGQHTYCFGNKLSSQEHKIMMYNVELADATKPSDHDHDKLQDMVTELTGLVTGVKHEMDFMAARDRVHRAISERINSNVVRWTLVEFFVTLIFAIGQTYYVKQFFETRRRV